MRDGDERAYHRESRRFHFALLAPAGMRRFTAMVESAWNLTEPYRPMAHVGDADRARLHVDHGDMLDAFTAGDAAALLDCATAHHGRLLHAVAALPGTDDRFAVAADPSDRPDEESERGAPCASR